MTKVKIDTAKYLAKLSPILKKKMRLVGEMLSTEAQRRVPVDTGALKGSIYPSQPEDDILHINASQEYAAHVELGTSKQTAQPYLRPAVYENGKKIERLLAL